MQKKIWTKFSLSIPLAILLLMGIVMLQTSRRSRIFDSEGEALVDQAQIEAQQSRLQLNLLKSAPTLGFRNLIADWTFL